MPRARLEGPGHGGRPVAGWLHAPDTSSGERPAALLVHLDAALDAPAQSLGQRLAAAGLAVLALDRPPDGRPPPDRQVVLDLEAALAALGEHDEVDAGRLAVVGLGGGGPLAFLAGCASRRVAAVVAAGGPLVRGELSAEHPVEPLELSLNLGAPLLVLFGAEDPATPPEHAARVEAELGRALRTYELERLPGCGTRFLDPGAPGYHPASSRAVAERIVRFLRESLPLD